ncbi:hypothetical protein D3C75_1041800 [compost metagenome]
MWRRDQGNADQAIVDQQADGRQILKKMLRDQFAHGGADPMFITGTFGFEQVGECRFMPVSLIQQRARFAGIAAVEHVNISDGGRGFGHDGRSPRHSSNGCALVVTSSFGRTQFLADRN